MPVWPFKKKEAETEETPPENVSYQRSSNTASELIADTSHTEAADFQAAMALFSGDTPEKSSDTKIEDFTWIAHDDGYHYKKNSDGSFQKTPHTKDGEGNYAPYS
jgi:hypothetical protein